MITTRGCHGLSDHGIAAKRTLLDQHRDRHRGSARAPGSPPVDLASASPASPARTQRRSRGRLAFGAARGRGAGGSRVRLHLDRYQPSSPPTGTITIDWYFTAQMPPTFRSAPPRPISKGRSSSAGSSRKTGPIAGSGTLSTVAAGSYFIWSWVNDLPTEVNSIRINAFSPGVVTVAHPGDLVHPSIFMPTPIRPSPSPTGATSSAGRPSTRTTAGA